jgi:hypothetical protein
MLSTNSLLFVSAKHCPSACLLDGFSLAILLPFEKIVVSSGRD